MKISIFLCFAVLLCAGICQSQVTKEKLKFSGIVFDQDSLNSIDKAGILINKETLIISKENGHINFSANPKDTILITRKGFNDIQLIIPDTLTSEKNLIGIFMGKDSVSSRNIIIYSRFDLNDIRMGIDGNTKNEKQQLNAKNSMNLINYQAKTGSEMDWDATKNQKNSINHYETSVEYKYMISPEQMVTFTGIIPYMKKLVKEKALKNQNLEITKQEEKILKKIYKQKRNKKY